MYDEMYGENEQLYVTLGYGDTREKEGRAEGRIEQRKEDLEEFSNALSLHGISSEQAEKILSQLRSIS
jgi:predicted transposase YdaD